MVIYNDLTLIVLPLTDINYKLNITNLSQIVIMRVPWCYKVLIFTLVSRFASSKDGRGMSQKLMLDEGLMKIDLLGISLNNVVEFPKSMLVLSFSRNNSELNGDI